MLYYISLQGDVLARPLSQQTHPASGVPFYSHEVHSNRFIDRSEWNIVWSCFATLFACSWVAIHPNIPAQSDNSTQIFFRRLMIMGYMLIAPEYVIIWAGRQWYAARYIANKHKDRGWSSTTHGFFASMGGFMLYENGVMTETLEIERLEELESKGRINWPSISKKEIEDRSKGDVLSKSFAVLQTTWFITHCIARGVYGLVITELEVTTLAFAVLNSILYFFWWNKPLGVACPVPVHLISSKREAGTQTTVTEYRDGQISGHDLSPIHSDSSSDTANLALSLELTPLERLSSPSIQYPSAFSLYCVKFKKMLFILFGMLHLLDMAACSTLDDSRALSVPTFYAPSCGTPIRTQANRSSFIGMTIGVSFGGLHCIAWSFSFPSVEEKYIWRASAIIITAIPVAFIPFIFIKFGYQWGKYEGWMTRSTDWFIDYAVIPYLISRTALLVLPLIALRSLPPGSLLDIKWSSFIPHI